VRRRGSMRALVEHLVGDPVADAGRERLVQRTAFTARRARRRLGQPADRRRSWARRSEQADRRLSRRIVTQRTPSRAPPAFRRTRLPRVVERQMQLGESAAATALVRAPPSITSRCRAGRALRSRRTSRVKARQGRRSSSSQGAWPWRCAASTRRPRSARRMRARAHALEHDRVRRAVDLDDPAPDGDRVTGVGGFDLGSSGIGLVYPRDPPEPGGDGRPPPRDTLRP